MEKLTCPANHQLIWNEIINMELMYPY